MSVEYSKVEEVFQYITFDRVNGIRVTDPNVTLEKTNELSYKVYYLGVLIGSVIAHKNEDGYARWFISSATIKHSTKYRSIDFAANKLIEIHVKNLKLEVENLNIIAQEEEDIRKKREELIQEFNQKNQAIIQNQNQEIKSLDEQITSSDITSSDVSIDEFPSTQNIHNEENLIQNENL